MTDPREVDPVTADAAPSTIDDGWPAAYDATDSAPRPGETVPRRGHGLGLFALVLALAVIFGTVIASILIGSEGGQFATDRTDDSFTYNLSGDSPTVQALALATGWQYIIGTALGVWAIVQGIVAIAKNRGRLFGALAVIIAVPGPLVSVAVTLLAASQNLPR